MPVQNLPQIKLQVIWEKLDKDIIVSKYDFHNAWTINVKCKNSWSSLYFFNLSKVKTVNILSVFSTCQKVKAADIVSILSTHTFKVW